MKKKLKKEIYILSALLLYGQLLAAQLRTFSGQVIDSLTQEPVSFAMIRISESTRSFTADSRGKFELMLENKESVKVLIYSSGFTEKEMMLDTGTPVIIKLSPAHKYLNEVVVTASRFLELFMKSSASIEKINNKDLTQLPAISSYEALKNLSGVQLVTTGLLFKQINTRGFNNTPNQRLLQLIDGIDNQPPGLNFPIGNIFGPPDIDIENMEIVPGTASVLYGPAAFNGIVAIKTKSPFDYSGISIRSLTGINHLNDPNSAIKSFSDISIRYGQVIKKKFAFKIAGSYITGEDWYATNYVDLDQSVPPAQRGDSNPSRNALNIYGDEVVKTIAGVGRVSRTGYKETDLLETRVSNLKFNANIRYRFKKSTELSYDFNIGKGTTPQTGSSRVLLKDYVLFRQSLELKSTRLLVRIYNVAENANHSYDTRRLAQAINTVWVKDLNGNPVNPSDANNTWFMRYEQAYKGSIINVPAGNHALARSFADSGRLIPGTDSYTREVNRIRNTLGAAGAKLFTKSKFYHLDAQYELPHIIKDVRIQAGTSFRIYDMFSNGTLYDDLNKNITISEGGLFIQADRSFLENKLKMSTSMRYDKNQNFNGRLTTRLSGVYEISHNQFLRASWQQGFRNPVPVEQYIRNNLGAITILGGVPANSKGLNVYENSFTANSVLAFTSGVSAAINAGATLDAAIAQNKILLQKSSVAYIKPERINTVELGYRGIIVPRLFVDLSYYHSVYKDFILTTRVVRPQAQILSVNGEVSNQAANEIVSGTPQTFVLFTNETDRVSTNGVSVNITYQTLNKYQFTFNGTWTQFNLRNANPNNIPAFNTPAYIVNVLFSNPQLTKRIGFSIACNWHSRYQWISSLASNIPGTINSNAMVDAMLSYRFSKAGVLLRSGVNNLLNNYRYQTFGGPSVGAIYYTSINVDILTKKEKRQ